MNKQTLSLLATIAPAVAAAAPPVLIALGIGAALVWLFSDNSEREAPQPSAPLPLPEPKPLPSVAPVPSPKAASSAKRVRREDIAEALEYGARALTRREAVAALRRLGFGKTAVYKALSVTGHFSHLMEYTKDGLIVWRG
jgi:hypothetical protein